MRRGASWTVRAFLPALVPAALGLVVWAFGSVTRAVVLWVIAGLMFLLVIGGVSVDRYAARIAGGLAQGVGVVLTGIVGSCLIAGGWVLRVFGLDPLTPRRDRAGGWHQAPLGSKDGPLSTAPFGVEPGRVSTTPPRRSVRAVVRACLLSLGVVSALLVVDLGVGVAWESFGSNRSGGRVVNAINLSGSRQTVHDSRADLPAMSDYPWADDYFRELQLTPNSYWPFTETRSLSFSGSYVNVDGWSRRSYRPQARSTSPPVVWMFGGSTTWGEGQRDEYTIASEIARISERMGLPVEVVNYGQRGWTHFQEMILFEQLLASEPKPDLALFYDGANEINAQTLGVEGVPTHTLADQYAEYLTGKRISPRSRTDGSNVQGPFQSIFATYAQHSGLRKVIGRLYDLVAQPSGEVAALQDEGTGGAVGHGRAFSKTPVDAENAVAVYERGRRLTQSLAADHGVDVVFFWQPVIVGPAERWANAHITAPTVNISDALDAHQDVFIDGGHTNEEGSRIVAGRIWREVSSRIPGGHGR